MSAGFTTVRKTVATAGTAEPLSTTKILTPSFIVRALDSNTGKIYIGDATSANSTDGLFLLPSEADDNTTRFVRYGIHKLWDLSKVYIYVANGGDGYILKYEVDCV